VTRVVRRDYDGRADAYDRRWRWYLDATLRETLARTDFGPEDRILDVACGTGRLLDTLARDHPPERLAGVDLSRGMLEVARGRLPSKVRLAQGNAAALPFPAGSFDRVVSVSAFHFWPRPDAGLEEIRRVLTPGGVLTLTDWSRDFWGPRFREFWLRALDPAHFRTWNRSEVIGMLERAGFRVLEADLYRIRPTWGMMTLTAKRPPGAELGSDTPASPLSFD
jgi:ubiquinone/menaquinone biosynthesis C-methylase UbiE